MNAPDTSLVPSQGMTFTIGNGSLVHPETAIRMNPFDSSVTHLFCRCFYTMRYFFGCFNRVHLDIDHADAQRYLRIEHHRIDHHSIALQLVSNICRLLVQRSS